MGQLDGKVAIVTGSGRGIGREIALRLVRDGAAVVINDIDEAPALETVQDIVKAGGRASACVGDVTAKDFGERIVETAVKSFGDCHIIVNNAGYTWDSVIQKMSDEQWYAIIDVHLTAPFRILRAFANHLKPVVEGEGGTIDIQGRTVKIGVQAGRIAAMNQMIPLGRGGLPEEAAGSVYLFCSPDSDYVSGQTLVVNGGL